MIRFGYCNRGRLGPKWKKLRWPATARGWLRRKQVGLALAAYETAHQTFPPGRLGCDHNGRVQPYCPTTAEMPYQSAASGFVLLLPHLEQENLQKRMELSGRGP